MQQFGLALVPVLAGYWLLTRTHLFKGPYETKTHHRVFFEPAMVGGALLVVSWFLAALMAPLFEDGTSLASVAQAWNKLFGFNHSAVLALTVALAFTISFLVNLKVNATDAANRWALANETDRSRILRESLEMGVLVEVALKNGQSHVGFVGSFGTSPLDLEGDLALVPELSGYRDPTTHRLVITPEYESAPNGFRIVCIPDEISSVSHFDPDSRYVDWHIH